MNQCMHARESASSLGVVEENILLNQRSEKSLIHGLMSQITALMMMVRVMASAEVDAVGVDQPRQDDAAHHAEQQTDGDERGKEQPGHVIPPRQKTAANLGLQPASASRATSADCANILFAPGFPQGKCCRRHARNNSNPY